MKNLINLLPECLKQIEDMGIRNCGELATCSEYGLHLGMGMVIMFYGCRRVHFKQLPHTALLVNYVLRIHWYIHHPSSSHN